SWARNRIERARAPVSTIIPWQGGTAWDVDRSVGREEFVTGIIAWLQTSEIAGPLEQLVRVQTVTAVGIAILSLIGIAIGVMALVLLRILWRTLRKLEAQVEQLAPKAEPLLENVTKVAED